jgi:Hydrogen maturase F tetramerization domain
VLVAEACNHNRITEACNDIGLVQIPRALEKLGDVGAENPRVKKKHIELVHAFGRELPELRSSSSSNANNPPRPPFDLAIHCGGCLIDSQAMRARMNELRDAGVPVTNYGLLLSAAAAPEAFRRVVEPWGLDV